MLTAASVKSAPHARAYPTASSKLGGLSLTGCCQWRATHSQVVSGEAGKLKDVFEGSLEFDKHIANKREQNGVTTCLLQHEVTAVMRCHLRCKKQVEIRRSQKQFGGKSLCASCDHLHVERVLNTLSCIVMYCQYHAMNLWP